MSVAGVYEHQKTLDTDIRDHLVTLHDLVVEQDAQIVVELGPGCGRSTSALLAGCEQTGGTVWSVDLVTPPNGLLPGLESDRWTYTLANDLDVVDECPRPIDVLFIDSAHDYDQTLAELTAYVPLLAEHGVLAMHDTVSWSNDIPPAIICYFDGKRPAREEWHTNCNGLYVAWM